MLTAMFRRLRKVRVPNAPSHATLWSCSRHGSMVSTRRRSRCRWLMSTFSHMYDKLDQIACQIRVRKPLPRCEHSAEVLCYQKPASIHCSEPCRGALTCCSNACKSACYDCQKATSGPTGLQVYTRITRTTHVPHPCERYLYCRHECGLSCSQDHHCNSSCRQACRQQCVHHQCSRPCSEPCVPCMARCAWSCAHHKCPVVCGSVSVRFSASGHLAEHGISRYVHAFPVISHVRNLFDAVTPVRLVSPSE